MRMRVKWLKLGINVDSNGFHSIKEIPNENGRYCKRNEVQSVLERINNQISDSGNIINHLINDMIEIRANSKENIDIDLKCKHVIDNLTKLIKQTKKCKRPKKEIVDDSED